MNTLTKKLGMLGAGAIVVGLALSPTAAQASVDGRRNTAIALGLGTIYELSQHNNGAAALLGIGTAVAAQQYEQARHEQSEDRNDWYYRGWGRDRRDGYRDNDDRYRGDRDGGGYHFGEGSWGR